MAASPRFKVYDAAGRYRASCHEMEDAACLVSFLGEGATVRVDHAKRFTVWTEGADGLAFMSYDKTADVMEDRIKSRVWDNEKT